jgi:hypothetical protein
MGFWSRVSQFLWKEAEISPAAGTAAPVREGSGVPQYLRKAVRVAVAGFVATVLTAGIVNVHLIARVDAEDGYTGCLMGCTTSFNTCTATCPSILPALTAVCVTQTNACMAPCLALTGAARDMCTRRCRANLDCCLCIARSHAAACPGRCVTQRDTCLFGCGR